jgi:hypothetical protein
VSTRITWFQPNGFPVLGLSFRVLLLIIHIHNNPVKAFLVRSASDYRWSSFRAFYSQSSEPLAVDKEWWWPDDVKKLSVAIGEWRQELVDQHMSKLKKGQG